jgi:predicted CXXCH cytochrome family protein
MATAWLERGWHKLIFLGMAAGGILLPAISVSGEASSPKLAILAPREGASLPKGGVLVIGKAVGEGISKVEIDVNGKEKQVAAVRGGGFSAQVLLGGGKIVIRARAGKAAAAVTVFAGDKGLADRTAYVYHKGAEKCAECHGPAGKGFVVSSPRDALCYRCHGRKDKGKLAHGPMGSGECTACHDPHGSSNKALTVARQESLCVGCHDQKSSEDHFRKSKGKACTACHDPHSSDKPFLQK